MSDPNPRSPPDLADNSPQPVTDGPAPGAAQHILRKPAHGKGMLRVGNPGNRGGTGPAPSIVRARCRGSFLQRVNTLERIADQRRTEDRDKIRAIDVLGKYGLMTGRLDIEDVRNRLAKTIAKIEETCDNETASRLITALDTIWSTT